VADAVFAGVTWLMALGAGAFYLLHVATRGRARSARADRDGGSALMSKQLVEFCLWSLNPFARLMARLGLTPDHVTWFSLALGIAAGLALAFGWFGIGVLLGTLSAFGDTIDGLLARLLGSTSEAGETLDAVADRYVEGAFFGGLVVYYRSSPVMMVFSLFALIGAFMISYMTAKAEAQGVEAPRGLLRRSERALYTLVAAGLVPFSRLLVPAGNPVYMRDLPMTVVIALIAVVGNISAVRRMNQIRQALSAPRGEP
jgi:CDP-diacylglycerol--glycerol-3-phosphate 3-phosphatidyltransferase